ncbi:MAG: hypothetical protein QOJ64_2169 [Acidobacteriota bacterium]|jgi:hypothetical protein|nr:hypothetical protein [Acidobacteriota bacterium]
MSNIKLFRNLTEGLRNLPSWDYTVALIVVTLAATASALRVSFNIGYSVALYSPDYLACIKVSRGEWSLGLLETYLVAISIGFFISAIGLWSRSATGFFLSLLALIWIWMNYISWHLATLSIMHANGLKDFSYMSPQKQHLLVLNNANWWDLVALAVTIILFVWQFKTLISIIKYPNLNRRIDFR